ncbi:MAG: sulfatase-like hydrolase/transferase [Myxococcota bacterium]
MITLLAACVAPPDTRPSLADPLGGLEIDAPPVGSAPSSAPLVTPGTTNVLVLVADDVGVDKVNAYGVVGNPPNTPNLDRLAADGVRFANAWALPFCEPTRAALQTGRMPRRTGLGSNEAITASPHELDPAQTTLAEVAALSSVAAYDTSFVGKWHLSSFQSPSGARGPRVQGWDWFAGPLGNIGVWWGPKPDAPTGYTNWQKVDPAGRVVPTTTYVTTDNVDDAIGRLDAMASPWVMQVAFSAAHGPYDVPPMELHTDRTLTAQTPVSRRERAIVEAMDTEIGRLIGAMSPEVRAATTVLFVGDNGTPELAVEPPFDPARSKGTIYDAGLRVPFIVTGPAVGARGVVSDALVDVVDVLPTVAALVGTDLGVLPSVLDPDQPLGLDGVSLLPVLADPTRPADRDVLYAELIAPSGPGPYLLDVRAVRDDRYKLVYDAINDREQFFAYADGAVDEGPDLLPCGLTDEAFAAYDRLHQAMDDQLAGLAFDSRWQDDPDPTDGAPAAPLLDGPSCGT